MKRFGILKNFCSTLKSLSPKNAAPVAGPYSSAILANLGNNSHLIFCSGSLGVDSKGNIAGEDIEAQTRQVMENIKSLLEENNSGLELITKTTIFLTDMNEFKRMNDVYASYFSGVLPARSTVEVKGLPKMGARVEIECIALTKLSKF